MADIGMQRSPSPAMGIGKTISRSLILQLLLGVFCAAAVAQYPARAVRMIVPFPGGSTVDAVARIVAQPLAASFSQQVVVDNKPGADGSIAALEVMRAPPDGYTLLFATNSPLAAVPTMRKTPPYDPVADFTPISFVGRYLHFVLVTPGLPVKSMSEFFTHARANQGKLNYGSGGTFHMIATAQLMKLGGISMTHVYYKGEPAALVDLIAGRIQFMVTSQGTSMELVKDGRLRAIATTSTRRSDVLPDVPTLAEAGLPPFAVVPWAALFGPAKMPADVVDRINREMNAALGRVEVREQFARQAIEPSGSTPNELRILLREQLEVWSRNVRELGLQTE